MGDGRRKKLIEDLRAWYERTKVREDGTPINPGCRECDVKTDIDPGFEEQEQAFIKMACAACPHGPGRTRLDSRIGRVIHYISLMNCGRSVRPGELKDGEWLLLGRVRNLLEKWREDDRKDR